MRWRASATLLLVALPLVLLAFAHSASAQQTWTGSGTYTDTSTPSDPSCTGEGTATITLDGTEGGSVTADLSFTLTSQSEGCAGSLNGGDDTSISGTLGNGYISASDGYGDTISGTLGTGELQLTLTTPYTGSGCSEWCQDTAQFSFTGSGTLGPGSGFGVLGSADGVASIMAGIFGFAAIVMALASLPGRIPPTPAGSVGGAPPPSPLQQPAVPNPRTPQPYPLYPGGAPVIMNVTPPGGMAVVPANSVTVSNGIPYSGPENPGVYTADPTSPTGWRWRDPRTGAWFPTPDAYTQWYGQR